VDDSGADDRSDMDAQPVVDEESEEDAGEDAKTPNRVPCIKCFFRHKKVERRTCFGNAGHDQRLCGLCRK
jgi:hypothetical protein